MVLGLFSHAVKQYQKVIEMAEKGEVCPAASLPRDVLFTCLAQNDTFVQEAAYNLSLIYVLTGATPLADALYRRWLSI